MSRGPGGGQRSTRAGAVRRDRRTDLRIRGVASDGNTLPSRPMHIKNGVRRGDKKPLSLHQQAADVRLTPPSFSPATRRHESLRCHFGAAMRRLSRAPSPFRFCPQDLASAAEHGANQRCRFLPAMHCGLPCWRLLFAKGCVEDNQRYVGMYLQFPSYPQVLSRLRRYCLLVIFRRTDSLRGYCRRRISLARQFKNLATYWMVWHGAGRCSQKRETLTCGHAGAQRRSW